MEHVLAVDIGGTKMAAGIVDAGGHLLTRRQVPTPGAGSADALFAVLGDLMTAVRDESPELTVDGCGIGCGGPMREGGELVSPLNIPSWRDYPLAARARELTRLPVTVDNDAKALALGEGWVGAGRGIGNFVAMVVSTGVGGGIVLDGRLLDGAASNAGHIGHVIVEPEGRRCPCGARGCLEAEASGRGIAAATGRPAKEASAAVRARTGRLVGRAVASVANLLDLRHAFVAGSVALGFGDAFFAAAQDELDASARLAFSAGTRISPAGLGDEGPLVGAAAVGWRALGHDIGVR